MDTPIIFLWSYDENNIPSASVIPDAADEIKIDKTVTRRTDKFTDILFEISENTESSEHETGKSEENFANTETKPSNTNLHGESESETNSTTNDPSVKSHSQRGDNSDDSWGSDNEPEKYIIFFLN